MIINKSVSALCKNAMQGVREQLFVSHIVFCIVVIYAGNAHAERIVYLAEQRHPNVSELFIVDLDAPGETTLVNKALGGNSLGVLDFVISPDGRYIAYMAAQSSSDNLDLYVVDITELGEWTRIGDLPNGYSEFHAKFSSDGTKLAFTASDGSFGNLQLYYVDLSEPDKAIKLNGALVNNGGVSRTGFEFTPDGTHVVYVASELESKFELYSVAVNAPGQSVRLNASGGSIGDGYEGRFKILPDSNRVVYTAVWNNSGVREFHVVSLDQPGQPMTLNAPLQSEGYVFYFDVSPDGNYATYTADQDVDRVLEVFLVHTDRPGVASRVNSPVQGIATLARFTSDSKRIIYTSDEDRGGRERDLYSVMIDEPQERVRLNSFLNQGVEVSAYDVDNAVSKVVYKIDPANGNATELMLTEINDPGSAIKLNGSIPNGLMSSEIKFSPSGDVVAFLAVETLPDSAQELFFSRLSEPGVSIRLNESIPSGGNVLGRPYSFRFLPAGAPTMIGSGSGSSSTSSGGGGAMFCLLALLIGICSQRRITYLKG